VTGALEADGVIVWHEKRAEDLDICACDCADRLMASLIIAMRRSTRKVPEC
jgi:hypothetical protein